MTPAAALVASLLATVANPSTWILGLAGFLVRGGIVLLLAPIVVVPSAVGLANVVAPTLTSVVFGGISESVVTTVVVIVVAAAGWLVLGGYLAAAAEAEGIRIIADDQEVVTRAGQPERPTVPGVTMRILLVRAIAAVPLVIALAGGSVRVVAVAYRELTVPSDVAAPLIIRVVRTAPEAIAWIVLGWVVAEIIGAIAARRIALLNDGVIAALGGSIRHVVRHPIRGIVAFVVPLAGLVAVVVPSAAAAATSWDTVRAAIATGAAPAVVVAWVTVFVVLWVGGLVLIGMVSAWRAAVWTLEADRTFGGVASGRPGDWTPAADSATLADLRPHGADLDPR